MSTTLVEPSGSSESAEAKAKPEPKAGNDSSSVPSTKSRQEPVGPKDKNNGGGQPSTKALLAAAASASTMLSATRGPVPLKLVLKEVELQKLHKLDIANQSFNATIWMEFVIPGGANDSYLCDGMGADGQPPRPVFPMDKETGRPLFKPSATWYAAQVDCRNGLPGCRVIDNKVMKRGDDLVLALRLEGSFTEVFELVDYPFDLQGLTITMVFNCRASGPLPIDISVDPECKIALTCVHLCPPSKEYTLLTHLHVQAHLVGHSDSRRFPGVSFSAQVKREAFFHLLYQALPMTVFSLLATLCAAGRRISQSSHRAHMCMVLVLTTATYRIGSSKNMPPVSYLTLIDLQFLGNALVVVLAAILTRVQQLVYDEAMLFEQEEEIPSISDTVGTYDLVATGVLALIWFGAQCHFAVLGCKYRAKPRIHDPALRDATAAMQDPHMLAPKAVVPPRQAQRVDGSPLRGTLLAVRDRSRRAAISGRRPSLPAGAYLPQPGLREQVAL